MNLAEYAKYDALGLAELVAKKQVSPKELTETAVRAIEVANPVIKAVVELYPDRIEGFDEKALGSGPFRGVPFLIKDVFGHEKGRKIEFGSRLCRGMMVEVGTLLRRSAPGFRRQHHRPLGRARVLDGGHHRERHVRQYVEPVEAGLLGGRLHRRRQAAVTCGMVPIAHGSDIGGSIRIPASWNGGVGLKPSRGCASRAARWWTRAAAAIR